MDIRIKAGSSGSLQGLYMPADNARACIIMVHGLGEHIGRYEHVAEALNNGGYSFLGVDLPGHGRSPGKRGHVSRFSQFNDIIDSMVDYLKTEADELALVLYGHSLGGGIVLNYLLKNKNMTAGIASSPWLRLSFEPPKHKVLLASIMKRILPSFRQPSGLNPEDISSDPDVVRQYREDPMVHDSISLSLFSGASENAKHLLNCMNEMKIPLLLMHGLKDNISSPEGSREFYKNNPLTELKLWEGAYHELHNEVFKEEVINYIINWLNRQNGIQNRD